MLKFGHMTDVACICHGLGENHGAKNFSAIPMTGTGQSFSDDIFSPNLLLLHHEGWNFFLHMILQGLGSKRGAKKLWLVKFQMCRPETKVSLDWLKVKCKVYLPNKDNTHESN